MSDFSSTSAGDLRKMLVESGKYSQEQADNIKGKTKLVEAVLALNGENEQETEDVFSKLIKNIGQQTSLMDEIQKEPVQSDAPDYNSVEWPQYVMGQFAEDEIDDKYPTLYGLRRVAEKLLGPIIQSGPTHIVPPTNENGPGRATCVYTVVFIWNGTGEERAFSSTGGAYPGNTDEIYQKFPEAIAEARAEARCLRKALKLKVMAAEEAPKDKRERVPEQTVSSGEWSPTDPISASQVVFIKHKCKEMSIELSKLVEKEFAGKQLEELNREQGKNLIELLNKYQTNTKQSLDVPEDVKG